MISKKDKIQKLALTLKESDILMKELEAEILTKHPVRWRRRAP